MSTPKSKRYVFTGVEPLSGRRIATSSPGTRYFIRKLKDKAVRLKYLPYKNLKVELYKENKNEQNDFF